MAQVPLYTTRGDWAGMYIDGYLYNPQGEWIGWVNPGGVVFSVVGEYIGTLSKDFRVLRKRDIVETIPRRAPPTRPALKIRMPSSVPLAPLMAELTYDTIDVFEEMPERLHTIDADPSAKDID